MIETEGFETQEGAQGQTDVVALGASEPSLRLLQATKLLEGAMVSFDVPSTFGKAGAHWYRGGGKGKPVGPKERKNSSPR